MTIRTWLNQEAHRRPLPAQAPAPLLASKIPHSWVM